MERDDKWQKLTKETSLRLNWPRAHSCMALKDDVRRRGIEPRPHPWEGWILTIRPTARQHTIWFRAPSSTKQASEISQHTQHSLLSHNRVHNTSNMTKRTWCKSQTLFILSESTKCISTQAPGSKCKTMLALSLPYHTASYTTHKSLSPYNLHLSGLHLVEVRWDVRYCQQGRLSVVTAAKLAPSGNRTPTSSLEGMNPNH